MSSNTHLKEKAIDLRKKGASYNVIRKTLGIKSKGTLSYWFKDVEFSESAKKLLARNNKLAYDRGLMVANKKRKLRINDENNEAYISGKASITRVSKDQLRIIGAVLYWGEGTKSEKRPDPVLVFTNSDPRMICVYMRFVREILGIPENRIRAGIHIYSSITPEDARTFWSGITKLPKDRFYIVNQVSKSSQNKRPFNILPFGTAVIRINSRVQFYKVKGMMDGIIKKLSK